MRHRWLEVMFEEMASYAGANGLVKVCIALEAAQKNLADEAKLVAPSNLAIASTSTESNALNHSLDQVAMSERPSEGCDKGARKH